MSKIIVHRFHYVESGRKDFLRTLEDFQNVLWSDGNFESHDKWMKMFAIYGDSTFLDKEDSTPVSWRDVAWSIPPSLRLDAITEGSVENYTEAELIDFYKALSALNWQEIHRSRFYRPS
jgi:hypothetical protein